MDRAGEKDGKQNPQGLTPFEKKIISAYRQTDAIDRMAVHRILGLEWEFKKTQFKVIRNGR